VPVLARSGVLFVLRKSASPLQEGFELIGGIMLSEAMVHGALEYSRNMKPQSF